MTFVINSNSITEPQETKLMIPTHIKSVTYDEKSIYVGTSNGKLVAIPIENLRQSVDAEPDFVQPLPTDSMATRGSTTHQQDDVDGVYMDQSSVALHAHKDNKIKSLLHIPLATTNIDAQEASVYGSLPNFISYMPKLGEPGGAHELPLYQSLVVSAGKGHVEYTSTSETVEDETSAARVRARNKSFQLLVWGHKNVLL